MITIGIALIFFFGSVALLTMGLSSRSNKSASGCACSGANPGNIETSPSSCSSCSKVLSPTKESSNKPDQSSFK